MTELSEQLRAYVDGVAEPVTLDEIRARTDGAVVEPIEHTSRGDRRRRLGLVAVAAAVVLAMVVALVVIRSTGDDAPSPTAPVVVPRLGDVAPTWSSAVLTFDDPAVRSVSTIAASDDRVVVAAVASQEGNGVPFMASAPQLGAMRTTSRAIDDSSFGTSLASPGGFVVAGSATPTATDPSTGGPPQQATVWYSPDGVAWTESDPAPFTTTKHSGVPDSQIRGIAWNKGRWVAVGDVSTGSPKKVQCCGLSPALWTSTDGQHWKRRILDLGDEFDPYMDSIVWFRNQWVATGRSGRFPLVVWTSTDLEHWDRTVVAGPNAGGRVTVANDALYIVGGISGGTKQDPSSTPTMWRSIDLRSWERVLTLPDAPIQGSSGLGPVMASGDILLAVATDPSSASPTTTVYESVDGRHWARTPGSSIPDGARITASGMVGDQPTYVGTLDGVVTAWSAVPHAPTGRWAAQCSILDGIRTRNEAEPPAPDPTKGQAGLDQLAQDYARLIAQAPDPRTRTLWRSLRPVFRSGVVARVSTEQRDAVAELDPLLRTHCDTTTGDVFKVVVQ